MSYGRVAVGGLVLAGLVGCAVAGPPDPELLAAFGPAGLLLAFAVGGVVAFPGMLLVGLTAAGLSGPSAAMVSGGGALLYVTGPFLVGRTLRPREATTPGWVRRLLQHVDRHPVLVVAGLRLLGQLSSPISYGLAATDIRFRDYLAGSALGLVAPITGVLALV